MFLFCKRNIFSLPNNFSFNSTMCVFVMKKVEWDDKQIFASNEICVMERRWSRLWLIAHLSAESNAKWNFIKKAFTKERKSGNVIFHTYAVKLFFHAFTRKNREKKVLIFLRERDLSNKKFLSHIFEGDIFLFSYMWGWDYHVKYFQDVESVPTFNFPSSCVESKIFSSPTPNYFRLLTLTNHQD
jgi:hypothetical protein